MELKQLNISSVKEAQFKRKNIFTVEDLVQYLPVRYNDFSKETGLLMPPETSTFRVRLDSLKSDRSASVPYLRANCTLAYNGMPIAITWFRQLYREKSLFPFIGREFYVAGKVTYNPNYRNYNVLMPDLFELYDDSLKKVYPVYRKIHEMSDEYLQSKIKEACSIVEVTAETLPYEIVQEYGQISMKEALRDLHTPTSMEDVEQGRERMLFDDLLYFALHNEWAQRASVPGSPFSIITSNIYQAIRNNLPFQLTPDQSSTIESMMQDAKAGKRINALIQGDVGCGKTIVATLLMVLMAENGYQATLMAPTQVLARQHYEEISSMLEPYGIHVAFVGTKIGTGKRERQKILNGIASGETKVIIGTEALYSEDIVYKNLALSIVDEEHRFGVAQRAALVKRAAAGVHCIKMSATPIPRSLAQVVYGNSVQLYTIKSMPNGRKPIKTGIIKTKEKLFRFIIKEAQLGHQTYVVCPLIDASDSERMENVKSVEEVSVEYQQALGPYGIRVGTLTGRNSKEETDQILNDFKENRINVLVSTTVIEVGVNVPTATTMVISNAERFGLASLHQLRGRVGRSDLQAFCVLDSEDTSEKAIARLSIMCNSTDGFVIAQEDMKLRGAGDFLGTAQSGDNKYMALMLAYPEKYEQAKTIARRMLDSGMNCRMMEQVMEERTNMDSVTSM